MSSHTFKVAYDGEAIKGQMDVNQLAPALLAFGNLFRESNRLLNGDKSTVNLYVDANFEEQCFEIGFEIAQIITEQVKSLLQDDNVTTAKELLELLGIIGTPSAVSLFGYLKFKKNKKIAKAEPQKESGSGLIDISYSDGSNITINQNIYNLSENTRVLKASAGVVAPLENEGVDKLEFRENEKPVETITSEDAADIREACFAIDIVNEDEDEDPQVIQAHLVPHEPVLDGDPKKVWKFRYGENTINVDISETQISQDAQKRGGVTTSDTYLVDLEITEVKTKSGKYTHRHKIVRVLNFKPGAIQGDLPLD